MAPLREGLRVRPVKEAVTNENLPKQKKVAMTSAERARLYRERLKQRADYGVLKEMHRQRNVEYRLKQAVNESDEKKMARRIATRERVRKHRELKKLERIDEEMVKPSKVLTRKQKEMKREKDRKRKAEERSKWTPQKWRRHREKCRQRYLNKKNENSDQTKLGLEYHKDPESGSKSKRTEQRALKKVMDSLPKTAEEKKKVVSRLLGVFGSSSDCHEADTETNFSSVFNELDRSTKRRLALKVLQKSRGVRKTPMFNISRQYFHRLQSKDDPLCLRKKNTKSIHRHHEVQDFFLSPENSTQLSEKKKIRNGKPRFVLKDTLGVLFKSYTEVSNDPVSFSLFKQLKPKNVRIARSEALNQCLCEICENVRLMISAINTNLGYDKKIASVYDAINLSLCSTDSHFRALPCIQRQCPMCGVQLFDSYFLFSVSDLEKNIEWKVWKTDETTKRKILMTKSEPLKNLLECFNDAMTPFSQHLFNAQWQLKEFSTLKKCPPIDSCVMVMDFAENYRCTLQDEAQAAHWSYNQVTVHPFVSYYCCTDCNKVVTDVIVIISADLKHDTKAVKVFTTEVVKNLEAKGYFFNRLIQWSDGCGAQYKCKDAFRDLTELGVGIKVERNFFGSRHGKNACDGESAVVKSSASMAVKSRRVVIQTASDLFAYCKTHLTKPDYYNNKCCHYRRDFIYIPTIDRTQTCNELKPVKGTRAFHCVKAVPPNKLLTRSLSCFCHGCENNGDCFNSSHVEPLKPVQLQEKNTVMGTLVQGCEATEVTIDISAKELIESLNTVMETMTPTDDGGMCTEVSSQLLAESLNNVMETLTQESNDGVNAEVSVMEVEDDIERLPQTPSDRNIFSSLSV